ncbi:MAG: DUF1846 domain-containing protein [Clostridia bacterium]|nr:DUF1846 domain-containing protein [Clostridia bacterium]
MNIGFDNDKYIELQSKSIIDRISKFNEKLYLEFGGKMFDDLHASRVLPGFKPDSKIRVLEKLKDKCEIIFCISAKDIERNKIRADYGTSYSQEVYRLMDRLRGVGLYVSSVVITLFEGQEKAKKFADELKQKGESVYFHTYTKGYPNDVDVIVSDEGYGKNPYIETTRPLVIVTAPGPASGKLATCLCQLYHEYKRGVKAGYAKFETFPIWNLSLTHPVNIAYESATADLKDVNIIDPYHLAKYGTYAVNYNRDIELFPVLKKILEKISGYSEYNSPTDMGVNMAGYAISNDENVKRASENEIIRRYMNGKVQFTKGQIDSETLDRLNLLMSKVGLKEEDRDLVVENRRVVQETNFQAVTIKLKNGKLISGKMKNILSATSACILNALKELAQIDDKKIIIDSKVFEPILKLKSETLDTNIKMLSLEDILIAMSICTNYDEDARVAMGKLEELKGCELHSSYILSQKEERILKLLRISVTSENEYLNDKSIEW